VGLYGRIVVMQVAIIFGGWFAMAIGSMAPLILLILGKTAADLLLQAGPPATPAKVGRAR
jgi:MFS superfamily sulfate permease-like transporter